MGVKGAPFSQRHFKCMKVTIWPPSHLGLDIIEVPRGTFSCMPTNLHLAGTTAATSFIRPSIVGSDDLVPINRHDTNVAHKHCSCTKGIALTYPGW